MAKKLELECIVCSKALEDDLILLCVRCLKEYHEYIKENNWKDIPASCSLWAYETKGLSQDAFSIRFERNLKKFFESIGEKDITIIDRGRYGKTVDVETGKESA